MYLSASRGAVRIPVAPVFGATLVCVLAGLSACSAPDGNAGGDPDESVGGSSTRAGASGNVGGGTPRGEGGRPNGTPQSGGSTGSSSGGSAGSSNAAAGVGGDAGGAQSSGGTGGITQTGGSAGQPQGGGGSGGSPDCAVGSGTTTADIVSIAVTNTKGEKPVKGDTLDFAITIRNAGKQATAKITPLIDSKRFSDYTAVPIATKETSLCSGETKVTVRGGPFLSNSANNKHYALGRGDYVVSGVEVAISGQPATTDKTFSGNNFTLAASNALLVPVLYDPEYFTRIVGFSGTPEEFLVQSFTRPNETFKPSSNADPDGTGEFKRFDSGFDEMMGVRHVFRALEGFPSGAADGLGWCERAASQAKTKLGLAANWSGSGTRPERHGFDYVIALTPAMGGGVACPWMDVQVSSLINKDIDRQQIIAVHESGHVFGAPHCDDVGNGSGQSLQGYVMCSGEKHKNYPKTFVWHSTSIARMSEHWD